MGQIILINIFVNYLIAMPLIIAAIIMRWTFLRYLSLLLFFLIIFNIFFWIIYLLYKTFILIPKKEREEKLKIEALNENEFVMDIKADDEEIKNLLNDEKIEESSEENLDEGSSEKNPDMGKDDENLIEQEKIEIDATQMENAEKSDEN